jgi:hypothetical protein
VIDESKRAGGEQEREPEKSIEQRTNEAGSQRRSKSPDGPLGIHCKLGKLGRGNKKSK